jgi:hypothetical protein
LSAALDIRHCRACILLKKESSMVSTRLIYHGEMPNLLCCDVTLRGMPNGDWVVFMLGGGWKEPLPENRIFLIRSTDQGQTWGKPEALFDTTAIPTEVTVIGGTVTLYYLTHRGDFGNWLSWVIRSTDSGFTWSSPRAMPLLPERSAFRGILRHSSGVTLLPYQYYPLGEQNPEGIRVPMTEDERLQKEQVPLYQSAYAGYQNGVLVSGDDGATWEQGGSLSIDTGRWIWSELGIAELPDGSVSMLVRVDGSGVLYRSDSSDAGRTWTRAYRTDIPNPGSKIRLFNLADGRIALIHNPNPAPGFMNRNPLSLWISDDGMKSWKTKQELVTFPGALSYPDGFIDTDGKRLHLAFDYNRHDAIYVGVDV